MSYDPSKIEPKWQKQWEADGLYIAREDPDKPKWYLLTMLPYTSGDVHVGHWYPMTPSDAAARYKRMRGYNVFFPIGFDAFGLPAENAAIKRDIHPHIWTMSNIENMRRQIRSMGAMWAWDHEAITCLPEYYKWTQWFFLKFYEMGLAYWDTAMVDFCPHCDTVLAREQVWGEDRHCERCKTPVIKKNVPHWKFRITKYADELLDFSQIDWPQPVRIMQTNWIGRSEGADVTFLTEQGDPMVVFTTRPDTLWGATFMVLAPEHALVEQITTDEQRDAVDAYVQEAAHKSELERTAETKQKSGVFTGAYAIHPLTGERIPIWVANYVLMGYGTGAIMAVPGHDQRDWEFARKFKLPIVEVLQGGDIEQEAFTGDGPHVNSDYLDGMGKQEAIDTIISRLEKDEKGFKTINYKLRDWIFSRQRYWGEPIPLVHCPNCGIVPVPEDRLPLTLPEVESYEPSGTGESPLANIEEWVNTTCPECGGPGKRETNTMPQWAGSCWYYLRYIDPDNNKAFVDPEKEKYWMPVDLYVGGAEHAVLHLLYARFWHKVLFDIGAVSGPEPFQRLVNQGMITSFAYMRPDKVLVPVDEVDIDGENYTEKATGVKLEQVIAKMSKSLKNVINPDDIIRDFGADSMRIYEMFMGPLEVSMPWQTNGLAGVHRFLNRVWDIAGRPMDDGEPPAPLVKILHKTLKKVGTDTGNLNFNTAIAQMMIFINEVFKEKVCWRKLWEPFVLILAPYAPHLSEEMWRMLGHSDTLAYEAYPVWDDSLAADDEKEIVLQVNGKLRSKITIAAGTGKEELEAMAWKDAKIIEWTGGKTIVKVIAVPDRLVNFVVKG